MTPVTLNCKAVMQAKKEMMMKRLMIGLGMSIAMAVGVWTQWPVPSAQAACSEADAARSGCCSWHEGVCGCNTAVGKLQCCDGATSPSCGC